MLEQLINHFFRYEFVYVFIFCTILFLLLTVIIKKQILKITSIFLFSVFFTLFIVEFFLFLRMDPLNNTSKKLFAIHIVDKNIDFLKLDIKKYLRYAKNGIQDGEDKFFLYNGNETTYQNGFRYTKCNFDNGLDYVFLGCSFVYGLGLEDNQTLPYLFSKMLNYEYGILNCGVSGCSSNTALNIIKSDILKKFMKKNKNIKHFIYFFIPWQPIRNFTNEFSSTQSSDNYIYEKGKFIKAKQPFGTYMEIFGRSYLFRKIFLNLIENKNKDFYEEYFINSLLQIRDIVKNKYNSKFTVLLWNKPRSLFNGYVIDKLIKTDIDYISLPEFGAEYVIPNDGHPNEKANREIAKLLLKHFQEQDKKNEK